MIAHEQYTMPDTSIDHTSREFILLTVPSAGVFTVWGSAA